MAGTTREMQLTIRVERSDAPPLSVVMRIPRPAVQPGKPQPPFRSVALDQTGGALKVRVDSDAQHNTRAEIPMPQEPRAGSAPAQHLPEIQAEALARRWLQDRWKLWSAG